MKKGKIIVTGGAGYLGRCTSILLQEAGYETVAFDNFLTSTPNPKLGFPVEKVDVSDLASLQKAWRSLGEVEAVVHFAALALVPESCEFPEKYFRNNLLACINLAQCCVEFGTKFLVHSSSCAVYGIPKNVPISEETPFQPLTPYGEAKAGAEHIFSQFGKYKGLKVLNLRYFNPAGAIKRNGQWYGEAHDPETHVIPNLVNAALHKKAFSLFGNDYDTEDGTCIRDFIHVEDLANAHLAALEYLKTSDGRGLSAINIGLGSGHSVSQLVKTAEEVLATKLDTKLCPKRTGDPPRLIADVQKALQVLRWKPQRTLADMIRSHADFVRACHPADHTA